ncbi:MAG TPA: UDP-N-acetylmuramoyl-L-alanyl-D-glutamate--2,6-diaminopimelate ligase [Burkholderiales bacterium]|nr:UDP-N-acetylmuramoyl-L-alanyl-D-glutamate--2,6-diaminopimelate ligase [Burkholderiales bacterium]
MRDQVEDVLGRLAAQRARVTGLAADSRSLAAGEVFLAYPGSRRDGREFIPAALQRGAAAVLWEREGFEWNPGWRVPNLGVENLRGLAGRLAHEIYGRPSERLWMIGVTGTNGKTSCSHWIAQACSACGAKTAVVGTLGTGFPGALDAGVNTTPDAVLLHRSLAGLLAQGAQGVAMEVTSIGLDQGRVNGVAFGAALFTNLSRDHLDYHGDMESYARAKQRLFETPGLKHAVLNLDDVQGVQIARALAGRGIGRAGYSCFAGVAARSGLERYAEAHAIEVSPEGIAFEVRSSWGEAGIESALLGRFNVSNLLGVLTTMLVSGVPFDRAATALAGLEPVAGRMQRLGGAGKPVVVVDYAHTPDALEKTLVALKDVAKASGGRLAVVFGCGGERDRGKRPLMGAVASRHADAILVTSDNPRGEDPAAIIAEISAAIPVPHEAIEDRRAAIERAIASAGAEDVVLIAGKGHETYQEVAGRRLPFSDALEAKQALSRWGR